MSRIFDNKEYHSFHISTTSFIQTTSKNILQYPEEITKPKQYTKTLCNGKVVSKIKNTLPRMIYGDHIQRKLAFGPHYGYHPSAFSQSKRHCDYKQHNGQMKKAKYEYRETGKCIIAA